MLGYPLHALADAENALKDAREIGQAATLMYALLHASFTHMLGGGHLAANAEVDELVKLANEKGALAWKAHGTMWQGILNALAGEASKAVQALTSGDRRLSINEISMLGAIEFNAFGEGPCGARPARRCLAVDR
jgi:hypothetical protein